MKRGYSREEFTQKLEIIKKINPLTFIGTDIIVGFPDETDKDFDSTYEFLEKSPISKFHIFRFSPRENTAAYFLKKRLKEPSPLEKIKRAKILNDLGRKKYGLFLQKHIDRSFSALFLERRKDGFREVLLDNQISAYIKDEKNLVGEILKVKIKKFTDGRLLGEIN
jgi:threonylcarbamoyladenosine tRNA methylthiotransferase MtaB